MSVLHNSYTTRKRVAGWLRRKSAFAWLVPVLLSCFPMSLPFDLAEATRHLSSRDETLAALIAETAQFQTEMDTAQSPYEALLESIAYQSISGKAAATIFARIKALSGNGRPPSPDQILNLPTPPPRKPGL